MSRTRLAVAALLGVAALTTSGCRERHDAARNVSPPGGDTLRSPAELAAAVLNATRQPGALATVSAAPVDLWTGPGKQPFEVATRTSEREAGHARSFGSITLQTALRTRPLGQYPCTSCHLGRKVVMAEKRIADAHQNVQPVHPKQTGALCSTCHAADNVELLTLESGERATLDESYRLCAQCHFAQADAWAHGAHGKRLDGWQGRRVVMGCADCHDPHQPALQPRIPFRAPQLERPRGHDK
jgi:uncharacterized protein YlaI